MLWGAVQAAPTSSQIKPSPTPSPSPPPQNVNVVNPVSSPVPVRDAENAARLRFQTRLVCYFDGGYQCHDQITVPSGKVLVIEFVSISPTLDTNVKAFPPNLVVGQAGTFGFYAFPVTLQIDDGIYAYFVGAHQTRLYADPSDIVRLDCNVQYANFGYCTADISGYLVSASSD